nr:MAG TPA: hypothetical protein [Microviridae sp.]
MIFWLVIVSVLRLIILVMRHRFIRSVLASIGLLFAR